MQEIIKLFQTFDKYKDNSYQELYYHILPSINLQQYKVFKDERGLYALVNWAKLDNKDEDQYSQTGLLYKGTIDTYAISESENESVLALTVVSHWADFEKRSGRLTNNNSQQRFFSTDVGMNFSSQTVLDIKWGRK